MITTKNRIQTLFEQRKKDEKILGPFLTAGYPDPEETVDLMLNLANSGADIIELGMPYSDPLADGPTIQYASNEALKHGIRMKRIFEMVREFRKQSDIPVILMGYMNPVIHYGAEAFCRDAANAGVDGLILPDLPPEEAYMVRDHALGYGLDMIFLVAPNTSEERIEMIDKLSTGFVYCVSVTGVTGARSGEEVSASVNRFINRVRSHVTHNPVLIGFGIKNHEDAIKIASGVEGFIVGSALIDCIRHAYPAAGWKDNVSKFVSELKFGSNDR